MRSYKPQKHETEPGRAQEKLSWFARNRTRLAKIIIGSGFLAIGAAVTDTGRNAASFSYDVIKGTLENRTSLLPGSSGLCIYGENPREYTFTKKGEQSVSEVVMNSIDSPNVNISGISRQILRYNGLSPSDIGHGVTIKVPLSCEGHDFLTPSPNYSAIKK